MDALMDERTDGRGCGRHRKTIPRYAEYFFVCLEEAGLEKKPLSPSLLSAVLEGDIHTTSSLHTEEGGIEAKEDVTREAVILYYALPNAGKW